MTAGKRWIPETLFDDLGFRMTYRVDRVLYEMQTEHQHLILFEHPFFGKMLSLDGATQVTTKDEFVYHEMMTHVPILAHGAVTDVLIVGGLPARHDSRWRDGHAERSAAISTRRTQGRRQEIPQTLCGRNLLHRGHSDLCGRPYGDGLGHRQCAAAHNAGCDHRAAL